MGRELQGSVLNRLGKSRDLSHYRVVNQDRGWSTPTARSYRRAGLSCPSCTPTTRTLNHWNGVLRSSWRVNYPYVPLHLCTRKISENTIQDGSWPQEAIEGIFNKTCAIAYPNFKFSFPIWMLGKAHKYLQDLKSSGAGMNGNGHSAVNGNGHP